MAGKLGILAAGSGPLGHVIVILLLLFSPVVRSMLVVAHHLDHMAHMVRIGR